MVINKMCPFYRIILKTLNTKLPEESVIEIIYINYRFCLFKLRPELCHFYSLFLISRKIECTAKVLVWPGFRKVYLLNNDCRAMI